jgi:hypothetical protein
MTSISRPTSGSSSDASSPLEDSPPAPAAPPPPPALPASLGRGDGLEDRATGGEGSADRFDLLAPSPRSDDHPDLSLLDQQLQLDEIFLRRLGDGGRLARTGAASATTLGEARVERQTEVTRRPLELLNEYAPKNNPDKTAVFKHLFAADDALDRARAQLTGAHQALDQAREKLARDPASAPLKAEVKRLEGSVERADGSVRSAEAGLAKADKELRTYLKKESNRPDAEIDALDISVRRELQTTYAVEVGGRTINLTDNNRSSVTTQQRGLTVDGKPEKVGLVIDASPLGPSAKTILKATSANEGDFSSINGYDKKGVSLGFVQFAGGAAGDLLPKVLQRYKQDDPAGFADALGQFGIDVEGKKAQLVCRDGEGHVLKGEAAARFIGSDPRLAAALSAAGARTGGKNAQIEISASLLSDQRDHKTSGTTAKMSDVITSEYGNGLLYDRSVNAGGPKVQRAYDAIVHDYLAKHEGADITAEPARAAIEASFIDWAVEANRERADVIAAKTNHEPGSFQP